MSHHLNFNIDLEIKNWEDLGGDALEERSLPFQKVDESVLNYLEKIFTKKITSCKAENIVWRIKTNSSPSTAQIASLERRWQEYYSYRYEMAKKEWQDFFVTAIKSTIVALAFILFLLIPEAYLLSKTNLPSFITLLFNGSISIAAWVALWRPIETFLFDWWPLKKELKLCQKLSQAKIKVISSA